MARNNEEPRRIKAVQTSCQLVEALYELGEARVTELADHVGVSKTTAYHHLCTLIDERFVVRSGEQFRMSLKFLDMGEGMRDRLALFREGREVLDELAEETGEYTNLVVEEAGIGYIIYKRRGSRSATSSSRIGQSVPLHSTGAGKAILAGLSDDRIADVLSSQNLEGRTGRTLTSRSDLWSEIERIRECGYAVLAGEHIKGVGAIAAPVEDSSVGMQGAISVTGPLSWMMDTTDGDKYDRVSSELANLVLESANRIEMRIRMEKQ